MDVLFNVCSFSTPFVLGSYKKKMAILPWQIHDKAAPTAVIIQYEVSRVIYR